MYLERFQGKHNLSQVYYSSFLNYLKGSPSSYIILGSCLSGSDRPREHFFFLNISFQMSISTYKYTDLCFYLNPDYVVLSFLEELTFLMVLLLQLLLISITLANNSHDGSLLIPALFLSFYQLTSHLCQFF